MINIRNGASAPANSNDLLSEADVAKILGVTAAAMKRMRYDKKGPPTIKVGSVRRIRRSVLEEWLKAHES